MATREQIIRKLEDSLKGSKFRVLNELLYRTKDKSINKELFEKYHEGYQEQVKKWPFNPVDAVIRDLRKMDVNTKIADLGCGEAAIEKSLRKFAVQSFDLVKPEGENNVVAADIRSLPLENESVDVAVICLALMGEDASSYIKEAHRILKQGGLLKVVDVRSRIGKIEGFVNPVEAHGFKLLKKDLESNFFCFFDFRRTSQKRANPPGIPLKPCVYKKR